MSTANAKADLNDAAASAQSAAAELKTAGERNLKDIRNRADINAQELRSKAENNASALKSEFENWKSAAEKEAEKAEKEAKSWWSFTSKTAEQKASDIKSQAKGAEKEAKGWFSSTADSAEKKKQEAEKNASSWFSSASQTAEEKANEVKSQAEKAQKEAKGWLSSSADAAEKKKQEAEKNASSWFSSASKTAEQKASEVKAQAEKAEKDAKGWFSSTANSAEKKTQEAEKNASSWLSSASKTAEQKTADLKSQAKGAEKDAKGWFSSADSKASDLKSQASGKVSELSNEAQNKAAYLQSSAANAAADLKSRVTGLNPVDPNAWVPKYSPSDYLRFFSAGALCATVTHGAMTPIDVIKTRLQLEPKGSKLNMVSMARNIVATEGASGLMTGFGPTAVGYLIQGGSKFCGFEYFKQRFAILAGSQEAAENNRTLIYMSAASSAELIASTLLTPLEAARIRLVSQRGYAKGLASAMTRMGSEGGLREFYAGYAVILLKQIPFTMAQFTINEYAHEFFNTQFDQEKIKSYGQIGSLGISLSCGLVAGIGAAIASHPADTILSKINKGEGGKGGQFSKISTVARDIGFGGLWAGLNARIVMQAALICAQMGIYDTVKKSLGAPPAVTINKRETSTK